MFQHKDNEDAKRMNTIWIVNSIILFIMFGYTFRKDASLKLIVVPMFLLIIRQELRQIDFEKTFERGSNAYIMFIANQGIGIMSMMHFISLFFHNI